ncbi:peptidoglycan recognition protein [Streptomyces sp. NPDC015131]|uniref:peptidoglycan recognition protein family protein n=1 Tax=Streptomyces sp. NPDC015131 TaxID=3364941 RepID=UPI0036F9004D
MRRRRYRSAAALAVLMLLAATSLVLHPGAWLLGSASSAPERRPAPRALHQGPRPAVVPRGAWHAESVGTAPAARYAPAVRAAVIHHTSTPNGYDCATVPGTLRQVYAGHAIGREWDDIGYNFLVDACGTIYEGRAGGVDRPVVGAHSKGFNEGTVGIAGIGTFNEEDSVPEPMLDAMARLVAWKLGPYGPDPRGRVTLVSTNDEARYPKGTRANLAVVSGHSDGYPTRCPGGALHAKLPDIAARAARLQHRP